MIRILAMFVLALAISGPATADGQNSCPTETVEQCAALFADLMMEKIRRGEMAEGDFPMEAVDAEGAAVRIRIRAMLPKAQFGAYLDWSAQDEAGFLAALRQGQVVLACMQPTRSIIGFGGRIEFTIQFQGGEVMLEHVVSSCPEETP